MVPGKGDTRQIGTYQGPSTDGMAGSARLSEGGHARRNHGIPRSHFTAIGHGSGARCDQEDGNHDQKTKRESKDGWPGHRIS